MKWLLGGFAAAVMAVLSKRKEEPLDAEPSDIPVEPTGPVLRPVRTEVDAPGRHWTWEELSVSATARRLGLDNTPTPEARANLRWMCAEVLDPLRDRYGAAVRVTSAYRSPEVNRAVGGVATSRHLRGLAVDVIVRRSVRSEVVRWARGKGLKVLEYSGHIHVARPS